MIATIDGVDGPTNKLTYNGFFLINGFTLTSTNLGTLNKGFINYQSSTAMDGSQIPTMLRVKGTVGPVPAVPNFESLVIFFDKLTPFFSNYYSGDIYCQSTDGTPFCSFKRGAEDQSSIYNYQTFSRI